MHTEDNIVCDEDASPLPRIALAIFDSGSFPNEADPDYLPLRRGPSVVRRMVAQELARDGRRRGKTQQRTCLEIVYSWFPVETSNSVLVVDES